MIKARGDVQTDTTPQFQALTCTHVGPYTTLRNTYADMMTYIEQQGLEMGAPTWEVYVNDPDTTPEPELQTDIFLGLKKA